MSAEFVRRDELELYNDRIMTYIDMTIQKQVRESERRVRAEMQAFREEMRQELQAFRERHDVEMAQVHEDFGRMQDLLLWMAQRLPQEPISPPPAQFLKHDSKRV